jgi:DNA polymerase-3 subunit epsilon
MYAIVDIETTGGSAERSRITEIAILIHDGKEVIKRYSTLVNPGCPIPYYITQFTGISDDMVRYAPAFHEIAKEIIELTEGAVFVAHNVRFDYGFVKAAFKDLGYNYNRKTLCTVRLSRNTFKGLPSYSLGNLCESLNIVIKDRHRALGDAEATAILFNKIIENNTAYLSPDWLPSEIKKSTIPPLLDEDVLEKLPAQVTGVYYFHNKKGDIIYVGKSKDIKKRILQHFSAADRKKAIRMQHEIADISFVNTGSELVALLLESDEIKRMKPIFNASQKRTSAIPYYGIYKGIDAGGYINIYISRLRPDAEPLMTADNIISAREIFYKAIAKFQLCLSKCDLHNLGGPCFDYQLHKCLGACLEKEGPEDYNARAMKAIASFSFENECFFIVGNGRNKMEKSLVCIENGQYRGFGYVDFSFGQPTLADMRDSIKKYNHNRDIQQILCGFKKQGITKIPFNNALLEMG